MSDSFVDIEASWGLDQVIAVLRSEYGFLFFSFLSSFLVFHFFVQVHSRPRLLALHVDVDSSSDYNYRCSSNDRKHDPVAWGLVNTLPVYNFFIVAFHTVTWVFVRAQQEPWLACWTQWSELLAFTFAVHTVLDGVVAEFALRDRWDVIGVFALA